MYLTLHDYTRQIQAEKLQDITGGSSSVRLMNELTALAEVKSYLVQRYDCASEFTDILPWNPLTLYKANQRFYIDYPAYSATATYALKNLVSYQGKGYVCKTAIGSSEVFNPAKWDFLGNINDIFFGALPKPMYNFESTYQKDEDVWLKDKIYTAKIQNKGVVPTDAVFGFQYWGNGVPYSIASGALPTDALFILGDNRSAQLVSIIIDISIYHVESRTNPRNIPQLRIDRYDAAIEWLKEAGGQNNAITADIPKLIPNQGNRTRFGGNVKNQNTY